MTDRLYNLLFFLVAPLSSVPRKFERSIEASLISVSRKAQISLFMTFTIGSIAYFFLSDYNQKPETWTWAYYRFSVSGAFLLLSYLTLITKTQNQIRFISLLGAFIICSFEIYQASLGFPLREKWLTLPSTIILCISFFPIIPGIFSLIGTVLILSPLWTPFFNQTLVRSDLIFCSVLICTSTFVWNLFVNSKKEELRNNELKEQNIQQFITLTDSIKTLISPVLVQRLDKEINDGQEIHLALDRILERKKKNVSVLYSDVRNYSTRSDNIKFLEEELLPSSARILDIAEENLGVGRQIGDNVMAYFDFTDHEDSIYNCLKAAYHSIILEHDRIKGLGRKVQERHFILTSGTAFVGNMGSESHKEASISGKPINLAARIDELTKERVIAEKLNEQQTLVLNMPFKESLLKLAPFEFTKIDLRYNKLEIRSYEDEKYIFLFPLNCHNKSCLNQLFSINNDSHLATGDIKWYSA